MVRTKTLSLWSMDSVSLGTDSPGAGTMFTPDVGVTACAREWCSEHLTRLVPLLVWWGEKKRRCWKGTLGLWDHREESWRNEPWSCAEIRRSCWSNFYMGGSEFDSLVHVHEKLCAWHTYTHTHSSGCTCAYTWVCSPFMHKTSKSLKTYRTPDFKWKTIIIVMGTLSQADHDFWWWWLHDWASLAKTVQTQASRIAASVVG